MKKVPLENDPRLKVGRIISSENPTTIAPTIPADFTVIIFPTVELMLNSNTLSGLYTMRKRVPMTAQPTTSNHLAC